MFESFHGGDGLNVKEIKTHLPKCPSCHPLLPQPPFLLTVVAPRKSGKTNLMVDAMIDNKKFRNKFDDVYIWSQTYYLDPKWQKLNLEDERIFTTWNDAECKQIIADIEQQVEEDPHQNILFIFDDMIDANIMNVHKLGCLESVAVRGRHSNISIIIISQQYMKLSWPIRNNTTNMVIFRIRNSKELKKIIEDNQESLSSEQFFNIYDYATKEPYSFLHINNQEPQPRLRFRKNWNELLILK